MARYVSLKIYTAKAWRCHACFAGSELGRNPLEKQNIAELNRILYCSTNTLNCGLFLKDAGFILDSRSLKNYFTLSNLRINKTLSMYKGMSFLADF